MKNVNLLLPLSLIYLLSSSCEENRAVSDSKLSMQGSWELIKYIPAENHEDQWRTYGDSILYQKHLSPNHFAWFKFDVKNNQLLGMGGGSYVVEDGKYIENIEFFFPPGSSELGQAIPFDYSLKKDNTWHHKGYAKTMAVNMETGKLEVIDSTKIEEVWKKSALQGNEDTRLVGTWDLIAFRDSLNGDYTEYPEFVGYLKLLTPTHFTWIYYDRDGDEIYAAGSGKYLYDGATYAETMDMIYPDNFGQLGSTVSFQANLKHNSWEHTGYFPTVSIDHNNGNLIYDSSLVDEKWKLHEASVMDGITF